ILTLSIPGKEGIAGVDFMGTVLSGVFLFWWLWIPAFAGMTAVGFLFFLIKSCRVVFLDSRFCGNDGGEGSVFSDKFLLRCVSGFPPARE
ncbi:hypothetical protein, partial [Neisseria meningitidis]|uniref:hypothetical protein n=1 Tax=Neisseria meningitidis TaxID=487 RepID=UPI0016097EF4